MSKKIWLETVDKKTNNKKKRLETVNKMETQILMKEALNASLETNDIKENQDIIKDTELTKQAEEILKEKEVETTYYESGRKENEVEYINVEDPENTEVRKIKLKSKLFRDDENNTLMSKTEFYNGYVKTMSKYYANGKLKQRTPYAFGKKHGIQKTFTYEGVLNRETQYSMGNVSGMDNIYDIKTSYPIIKRTLKNGNKNGETILYYETGEVKSKVNYKNNLRHGVYREYDTFGNLILDTEYVSDIKDGLERRYKNGKVDSKKIYSKGLEVVQEKSEKKRLTKDTEIELEKPTNKNKKNVEEQRILDIFPTFDSDTDDENQHKTKL